MKIYKTNELEKKLNKLHLKYREEKKALITKVPVPFNITDKGLIAQSSTVDYTGLISGGLFIAFDAKECQSKTSFPISNIHQHQLNYLRFVKDLNGIAFFMIHMKKLYIDEVFITPITLIEKYCDVDSRRKSIPIKDFNTRWLTPINLYLEKINEIKHEL